MNPRYSSDIDCPYFKTTCKGEKCAEWYQLIATSEVHKKSSFGYCVAGKHESPEPDLYEIKKKMYDEGFKAGMLAYSVNIEKRQYVDGGKLLLTEAIDNLEQIWSYAPRVFSL